MKHTSLFRFACLALMTLTIFSASAQTLSRPKPPSNSVVRSREDAVRIASQRYRDAQSAALKAKTESERKSAERSLDMAGFKLKNAEADLRRAQEDYDRKMDRYNRDLEAYQKNLESRKK